MSDPQETFWLRDDRSGAKWREVTRAEWIGAERAAGFQPKGISSGDPAYHTTCATGSFGTMKVSGTRTSGEYPNF